MAPADGPFLFGELPDDYGAGELDGEDVLAHGGWVEPEARAWRHPSELGRSRRHRARARRRWALASASAAALLVALSVAALAHGGGAGGPRAGEVPGLTVLTTALGSPSSRVGGPMAHAASAATKGMVEILPTTSRVGTGTPHTGVVMAGGTLVVTAAQAVRGIDRVDVASASGQTSPGEVIGVDELSGVAVVRLDHSLAPASFSEREPVTGAPAFEACMCRLGGSGNKIAPALGEARVRHIGMGAVDGTATLLDAIEVNLASASATVGTLLLDNEGRVSAVLAEVHEQDGQELGDFVPTSLVLAVAEELATVHRIERGWLGVVGVDQPNGGVRVLSVLPGSPAARSALRPGDVIVAAGGQPISSMACLQARLHIDPPGSSLLITMTRDGSSESATAVVGRSPS